MISRRALLLGTAAAPLFTILPAAAQESCGAENDILVLADYVLANRSKLPKLQSKRQGALSAYLKIHYQQLSNEQIEGMIGPLVTANVDRARELLISWRISTLGLQAMLSAARPEAENELLTAGLGISMLRAAVMSGEIPLLFDKMAARPESSRFRLEVNLVNAMLDLDDASALEIASEALSRDLLFTAGGIIASHSDLQGWQAFLTKVPDKKRAEWITGYFYWLPALRGRPELPHHPSSDAKIKMMSTLTHQALVAAARTPEREFLMSYLNYSGDYAGTAAASTMINDLTRDGTAIDMETAWLVVYETLKEAAPSQQDLEGHLIRIPFSGTRFGGTNVREALDTMLAVEAFKAAASGKSVAPEMVDSTSREFVVQLPSWREAAEAIGQGADLAPFRSSGQKLGVVANLLFATGRFADLTKFLTSTVPNGDSIRLAEVYAEALDRRCGGHLAFPAEAVTMPGAPLFRFKQ